MSSSTETSPVFGANSQFSTPEQRFSRHATELSTTGPPYVSTSTEKDVGSSRSLPPTMGGVYDSLAQTAIQNRATMPLIMADRVERYSRFDERGQWDRPVTSLNGSEAEDTRSRLEREQQTLRYLVEMAKQGDSRTEEQDIAAMIRWISSEPYIIDHNNARRNRMPGSCDWFFGQKLVQSWVSDTDSCLLWVHGIAGAGKTKLISHIIDQLPSKVRLPDKSCLAFFYCGGGSSSPCTAEMIFTAILKQMASVLPFSGESGTGLMGSLHGYYQRARRNGSSSGECTLEEYAEMVEQGFREFGEAVLILDAFEQCDKRTRLSVIDLVKRILGQAGTKFKVLISSRSHSEVSRELRGFPAQYIDGKLNASDIESFVVSELQRIISNDDRLAELISDTLYTYMKTTLVEKANGMFLWVDMQIKALTDSDRFHTEGDIRGQLESLPLDLQLYYDKMFRIISSYLPEANELTTRSLQWLMCAQEPLSPGATIGAVAIPIQERMYKGRISLSKDVILRLCQGLAAWDSGLDSMRLAHHSVQQYLELKHWSLGQAHAMAAETCLYLLCRLGDETLAQSDTGPFGNLQEYLCGLSWIEHLKKYDRNDSRHNTIVDLQRRFFTEHADGTSIFKKWIGYRKSLSLVDSSKPVDEEALIFAARHGLIDVMKFLLD